MARKKRVIFWAFKPIKSKISFRTRSGERVTFYARIPKITKITFKKKRRKK